MGRELWQDALRVLGWRHVKEAKADRRCVVRELALRKAAREFEDFLASKEGEIAMALLREAKKKDDEERKIILCKGDHFDSKNGYYRYADALTGNGLERLYRDEEFRRYSGGWSEQCSPIRIIDDHPGDPKVFMSWLRGELDKIAGEVIKKARVAKQKAV